MVPFTWDNMLRFFRWVRDPDRVDPPYCDVGNDSVMIDGEVRRKDVEEWSAQHGGSSDIVLEPAGSAASGSAIRKLVECDENCGAFLEPVTIEEYRQALEHWMVHHFHYGCSHGC